MARTRDVLIEFARKILEDDDMFLMRAGDSLCLDGWVEGLTKEQADFLMEYRKKYFDTKTVRGEVEDGSVQGSGLRRSGIRRS